MNQINHVGDTTSAEQLSRIPQHQRDKAAAHSHQTQRADHVDQADISDLGKMLSRARELPDVREEKVAAVRRAVEQDAEQFIRERLEITVDRLVEELTGG